jgi:hypothetical protein
MKVARMKTASFRSSLNPDGGGEDDRDDAWQAAGRRRFEAAYADEDSVYEQLVDDTPTR